MKPYSLNLVLALALLVSGLYSPVTLAQAPSSVNAAQVSLSNSSDDLTGPRLLLRRGAFDPLMGEPAIPPGMSRTLAGQPGLRLIQFPGPIQDAWYAAMLSAGLEVVTYIPDYGYLVWGSDADVAQLQSTTPLRWAGAYHPFYALHPDLTDPAKLPPTVEVIVQVYNHAGAGDTVEAISKQSVTVVRPPQTILTFRNLGVRIASDQLNWLAGLPDVVNVEPRPVYQKTDEMQGQIMAGALNASGTQPSGPGYLAWLQSLGFSTVASDYPIVDVTDDGIDNGTATPLHPDFYTFGITTTADRLAYNVDWTGDGPSGIDGHGNINASIVAGYNNRTGSPYEDSNGYNYGLGINPYGRVAGSKVFCDGGSWCLANDDYTALISQTFALGGRISSDSWGASTGGAYTTDDQAYDALVRDAQPGSGAYAGNQEMTIVFSAGNSGSSGSNTTGSPGNAKNVVTVGAAENVRPGWTDGCGVGPTGADNAQDIIYFSSRGPTDDQRVKPDLVAPGTHIEGAASQATGYDGSGVCDQYMPAGQTLYAASSGTSHSAPAVAGAASLVYRHYQEQFGSAPSPAMIKANLVNATRYLTGTSASGNLPSNNQGYGETLLGLAFDNTPRTAIDQSRVFTDSGQVYELRGTVRDPAQPFRVTLAWTDVPGPTTGNSYVNNLDLAVAIGGQVYKGNVFAGATSTTGGSADPRNNVESVFLPAGQSGLFTVYITATNIAGDGVPGNADPTDQDFALLIYNGMQQFGYLDGIVYDGTLGGGLEGATVRAITGTTAYAGATSATGYYTLTVAPDTYSVSAWKYGYTLQTITDVVVLSETVATRYLTLTQTSLYSLTGCITDSATSAPLATNVSVLNPFGGVITQTTTPQATGCYAFSLYGGPYTVTAQARLHLPGTASVNLVGDAVQNFALTATTTDGILWGRVTSMTTGNPVGGATIQATPGLTSTSAGADGNYEMQLPADLYTITVSAPLYSTVVETNVVVPQSNLVERNYALPTAHMTLLPPEGISVTLRLGQQVTRTLTISNSGAGGLEFQSQESRGGTAGGGPDPFGYTFLDSENPDGPAYTWVDITDGTPLALTDDAEANVTLPFPFKFYGMASSNLRVGNNGGVLFDATSGDVPYSNDPLSTTAVSNIIAPYWDDLGGSAGNVFIKTVGAAPNRQFIVEWYNRPHYKSGGDVGAVTLEVILYEATNNIKFQYQDVVFGDPANPSWDLGGSATGGIRQSGNNYLQYLYNSPVLTNSTAICFRYPGSPSCDPVDIPWLSMSPISGTVGADDSLLATATFNAGAVTQTGVYSGVLRFYTNDPEAQPYTSYPVTMTVVPEPPAFTLDKVPSANRVEIGLPMSYSITVNNSGGPATGVVISDTLPGNTLFAWASSSGAQVGNTVMWSGLNVRDGASMTVAYGVTVTCVASGTQIVNDDYQVYASERLTPTVGLPVTVTAVASGPLAGFTFTAPALRNRPVAFTNLSQNATAFAWAFGDGAMSTLLQPTHTYTEARPYTVALTASNLCAYNVYSQVLTVEDYAVALYPAVVSDHAMPGQVVTYSLWLTNTGTLTDTFTLSVGSHAWSTALSTNTVSALGPNLSAPIKVYVTVPTNARAGAQDVVSVAAVSASDPRAPKVSALSIMTSTADAVYGVTLTPPAASQSNQPGATVTYTLRVTNTGNAASTFVFTNTGNTWDVHLPVTLTTLTASASRGVLVHVTIPSFTTLTKPSDVTTVTAVCQEDSQQSGYATLTTTAILYKVYVPLVLKPGLPHLVVRSIVASSRAITVVIENIGLAPVVNPFWVDAYIDPHPAPTAVNQMWYDGRSAQGIAWGVTQPALPLLPGGVVTLTVGDQYDGGPSYTFFTMTLPAETPVWAQVDSYDAATSYGAVLEIHEAEGGTYNNILGPVYSTVGGGSAASWPTQLDAVNDLPRQAPLPIRPHRP